MKLSAHFDLSNERPRCRIADGGRIGVGGGIGRKFIGYTAGANGGVAIFLSCFYTRAAGPDRKSDIYANANTYVGFA